MKKQLLLLFAFIFLVTLDLQGQPDPTVNADLSQLIKTRRQIRKLTRQFGRHYRRSDNFQQFGKTWLSIPIDSIARIKPVTAGSNIAGLRMYYGLNVSDELTLIFAPVTLEFVTQVDHVDSFRVKETGVYYVFDKSWIEVNKDPLMENYNKTVQKSLKRNDWKNLDIDATIGSVSDPSATTIPWLELDSLIISNSQQLSAGANYKRLKRLLAKGKTDGLTLNSRYFSERELHELTLGWSIKELEFRSIAEIESTTGTYRHNIGLYPNLSIIPHELRGGAFKGVAANMGHLCPPKCETIGIAIQ